MKKKSFEKLKLKLKDQIEQKNFYKRNKKKIRN